MGTNIEMTNEMMTLLMKHQNNEDLTTDELRRLKNILFFVYSEVSEYMESKIS